MAWKLAIGQVCPPGTNRRSGNRMMMLKVRHTDCQLYACAIRRHGKNLLQEIEMGSLNQKLNFNGSGSITSVEEERELICLLLFTCHFGEIFLFLWVLGMGCVILLWYSLSLPLIILYPRWSLPAAVIAGYSHFSRRSNFGYFRFR